MQNPFNYDMGLHQFDLSEKLFDLDAIQLVKDLDDLREVDVNFFFTIKSFMRG